MTKRQWFEILLSSNTNYKLYSRGNRSYLIVDTTPSLQVLDKHSQFQNVIHNPEAGYYYVKVNKEKAWVPILPGFTIFTNIKNNIFQLSIGISENQKIMFSWIDFGENVNDFSNVVASNFQSDRFQSLITYINFNGKISIPNLLGFNIPGIVRVLVMAVHRQYPHLYPNFQLTLKAQQATEKATEVIQRKAKRLREELEDTSSNTLIREGLLITSEEAKHVNYEDFMVLLVEHRQTKQLLYNANRQIKHLKQKLDKYKQDIMEEDEEDNNNPENQDELLTTCINKIIEESKLGSTVLISTENFLSLVLQQYCDYCGEARLLYKKLKVLTAGCSIKISVVCQSCKTSNDFTNESLGTNFNACVATAGLVGGTNRRSLQMVFACAGITLQLGKVSFHRHQALTFEKIIEAAGVSAEIALQKVIEHHKIQGKQVIPVSFDCSWSHVRNAQQASGEMIYDGRDIEGIYF